MKNISRKIPAVFLAGLAVLAPLFLSSCDDKLNLEYPVGRELETNFYQTEKHMFEALVAAYDPLAWPGRSGWGVTAPMMPNIASDDTHAGGSDASDQPGFVAYDMFTLTPTLGPQEQIWGKYYVGVYRSNLVIEKMDGATVSDAFRTRTLADAKFLRAYYYFELLRYFGDVPLILKTLSLDDGSGQVRTPAADVFAQIEKDLKDAIVGLPLTLESDELGRATKGAAQSLLARVILFQNDNLRMAEAAELLQDVIASNVYALLEDYGEIFKEENEFHEEAIFSIVYSQEASTDWDRFPTGTEGNVMSQLMGMRDLTGNSPYAPGWSFCPVTLDLVEFMRNDPRFEHSIIDGNALKASDGVTYTEGYQNTDYFVKKGAILKAGTSEDGNPVLNWGINHIEIRYADVLLMAAEAIARSGGNEAEAVGYINQVRSRVGLDELSLFLTGNDLLNAIYDERRVELALEGQRFWDLIRTNRAEAVLKDKGFVAGKHEVLPIPQIEIDRVGTSLKQNLNY